MFNHLPLDIRETIFSRVRYVDLFETARVSQECWTLSMASFERVVHAKDDFLLDQVDFCNEMMPKEEPWQWWMLMEFTKSKKLYLEKGDFRELINEGKGKLIQYFKDIELNVKHLTIGQNMRCSVKNYLILPQDLNQRFPDLISLELNGVEFEDGPAVALPTNLRCLKFFDVRMSSSRSLNAMLADQGKLKILQISANNPDVYFDGRNCQNLTRLSIDAACLRADDESETIHILKSIVNQNKGLQNVTLYSATITKKWLQMFPSHVIKLELKDPRLSSDLIRIFGGNVLYERMTLFYIFENWKSVAWFKTSDMTWDKNLQEGHENILENEAAEYQICYVCKPNINIEEIEVNRRKENFALNDVILRNTEGLELTTLSYTEAYFPYAVPRTVRKLHCGKPYRPGDLLVLEDASVLERLFVNPRHFSFIHLDDLSNMSNLRKLHFKKCESRLLERILVSCTSLTELKLEPCGWNVFKDIASDIQSFSVKHLTIINGDDTFENILKLLPSLNTLNLDGCSETSILQSDVNAICHLQYFEASVNMSKEVAVHLSSLAFPYMFFACCHLRDFYAASKGMKLENEISVNVSKNNQVKPFVLNKYYRGTDLSLAYAKNVATRFLRNPRLVVDTVHDFIAKHENVNRNKFQLK